MRFSKLLICLLFISVNFGFTLRKIKVVVVVVGVVDENSVQSPEEGGGGGGIHDFRFNPAINPAINRIVSKGIPHIST